MAVWDNLCPSAFERVVDFHSVHVMFINFINFTLMHNKLFGKQSLKFQPHMHVSSQKASRVS